MQRTTTAALLVVGLVLGSAWGGGGGTNPPPPPPPPPPPGSPVMAKANPSGDAQSGVVATVLPSPLRVIITQNGAAAPGRTVTWSVQPSFAASVSPTSTVTDPAGIASTTVTLPQFAVTSTITASSAGVTGSPLSFSAISTGAGLAVTVSVINNQFQPAQFQLKQGGTVSFVWGTVSGPHTVTPVAPNTIPVSTPAGVTHSAPFSFDALFPAQGVFNFFCEVHSGMSGTITVVP